MNELLAEMPRVLVSAEGARAVRHGRSLSVGELGEAVALDAADRFRIVGPEGELLALGVPRNGRLHPHLVLVD